MNNINQTILTVALALAIAAGIFLAGRCSREPEKIRTTDVKIVRDTIINIKAADPIVVEKAVPVIEVQKDWDTIIVTKPFVAKIDTIIKHDTIHADYWYPQNRFSLMIRPRPDSTIIFKEYIINTQFIKDPWWEKPAWTLGGLLVGFGLGRVTK